MATSQTSSFVFIQLPNTTTCAEDVILWNYTGPETTFSMLMASSTGSQADANLTQNDADSIVLASNLFASSDIWTWPSVNVTEGWYTLHAVGPGVDTISSEFRVTNGTNVSCLNVSSDDSLSASRVNVPAIVGGTLTALVVLGVITFLVYRHCRRNATPSAKFPTDDIWEARSSDSTLHTTEKGGDVKAFDRHAAPALPPLAPNRRPPSLAGPQPLPVVLHLEALPSSKPPFGPSESINSPPPSCSEAVLLPDTRCSTPSSTISSVRFETLSEISWSARRSSYAGSWILGEGSAVPSSAASQMYHSRTRDSLRSEWSSLWQRFALQAEEAAREEDDAVSEIVRSEIVVPDQVHKGVL